MSSVAGFLGNIGRAGDSEAATALRADLAAEGLTRDRLDALMRQFVKTAEAGTHAAHGWPNSPYVVSKIGWSALSRIQQKEMEMDPRKDIAVRPPRLLSSHPQVNHVHPGYVDTDMTSHKGPLSIDRGAQAALFAAVLPTGTEVGSGHDARLGPAGAGRLHLARLPDRGLGQRPSPAHDLGP
jgi:carbonyl reductase 1